MPNVNQTTPQQQKTQYQMGTNGIYTTTTTTIGSKYSILENNNHSQNGLNIHNTGSDDGGCAKRSFIQQRVERLYGPGALAQGFYSPKKMKDPSTRLNRSEVTENGSDGVSVGATTELARKFQELSPSKDYNQFRKKLSTTGRPSLPTTNCAAENADNVKSENNNIDLPCLRHLSQEFRAQLPMVSPKRNFSRTSPGRDIIEPQTHTTTAITTNGTSATTPPTVTSQLEQQQPHESQTINLSSPAIGLDELDHKVVVVVEDTKFQPTIDDIKVVLPANLDSPITQTVIISTETAALLLQPSTATNGSSSTSSVRDAHFFLKQLKDQQIRLLIMAAEIEKYLDALESNPDITEDTLGILRSAAGKARLLVSQKMKQFEGLCHNNLNSSPEDKFPTTVDDLQGFWDMVYLQVDHVDSLFADIEAMKKNDWKKPVDVKPAVSLTKTTRVIKTPLTSKTKLNTPMTNGASLTAAPSAAALKREAQRKKLQEMKRRNREALAANANTSNESSILKAAVDINNDIEQNS